MMSREERRIAQVDWFVDHPTMAVRTWCDDVIVAQGFDVRSAYVETYWLPVLGPSAVLTARRLADFLDRLPAGVEVSLVDLGSAIGIGTGTGRNTQINRTLTRLADFGMAQVRGDHLAVRTTWAPLPLRLRQRLPPFLADALDDFEHAQKRAS